jgi:hypothetical protein
MRRTWLRVIWALAAFVPLALVATLIVADRLGVVFLFCAAYPLPASWAARQLGIEELTPQYVVVAALYSAALGWVAATVVSRVLRLPALIERRRAIVLFAFVRAH